jgi:PAS domain-containing protein
MTLPKPRSADLKADPAFVTLLTESYAQLVRVPLVPNGKDAAWLYRDAPFAVVAHNTDPDPRFIYANEAAQTCFEYSWDEFIGLPSRLSAEASDRAEQQALLDAVAKNGFMSGYRGIRVAKSGRRFLIEDGVVWDLIDQQGIRHGAAATFPSWRDV